MQCCCVLLSLNALCIYGYVNAVVVVSCSNVGSLVVVIVVVVSVVAIVSCSNPILEPFGLHEAAQPPKP